MAGEEAIVHERLVSVTSAGAGELAANSGGEHESIVGWGCEIADEWLTRGARNEIHICDSNMNGSYEREAISRRYPNNEKSIQSYPSPEFLNSLSFIKKFYPLPVGAREKLIKVTPENSGNSRHSERIAKESSLLQYKAAVKNENNSTETDHASMHLGIFASKLTPDVGIAMPTYFDFASKSVSCKTNVGEVGTPPY